MSNPIPSIVAVSEKVTNPTLSHKARQGWGTHRFFLRLGQGELLSSSVEVVVNTFPCQDAAYSWR